MGTQVTAAADHNTKPNYTVATVLAASVAVTDGQFAIWIGNNVPVQVQTFDETIKAMQALREAGWLNPTTGVVVEAIRNALLSQSTDTLTEDCVAVIQGFDFTLVGDSNSGHVRRMLELWLETTAKAA